MAAKTMNLPTLTKPMGRLSDFAVKGEYTPMAELEGKDLILVGAEFPIETKFGDAWKLNLVEEDEIGRPITHQVLTSAVVISETLEKLEIAIGQGEASYPVAVRFVRPGKAWLIE